MVALMSVPALVAVMTCELRRMSPILSAAVLLCVTSSGFAQSAYPSKPVRLLVPFAAGGSVDIVARIVTDQVSAGRGARFILDYRPGAGGTLGVEAGAKAAPDGYTLVFGTVATHVIAPFLFPKLGYDPVKDFVPLTVLAYLPNMLTAHPSLPVKTIKELIVLAKARPGQLNYGSSGNGTAQHLGAAMLEQMAGIRMTHVPYRSGAPAITDLLGGHITMMFITLPAALPHVTATRLRGIAVTSAKRAATLPDVPAIGETLPGYDVSTWYGVWFPANTPRAIVSGMYADIAEALKAPELLRKLTASGGEPGGETPEQFAAFIKREQTRWGPVVRQSQQRIE